MESAETAVGQGLACVCVKAEEAKEPDDEALETVSITPIHIVPWPWLLRACFLLGFGFGNLPTKPSHKDRCHDCCTHPHEWNRRRWLHMGVAAAAPIILDQAQFGLDREHQLDFKSSV